MKKTNTFYWIFTGLFAALMLFSSIPDIFMEENAVKYILHLGYPAYFIVFIGIAKFLGSVAILIPGFPRIKEWAYAGLVFDLIAALYSQVAVGDPAAGLLFMILPFGLAFGSYYFYHKKINAL
jgi:hypothetical protein